MSLRELVSLGSDTKVPAAKIPAPPYTGHAIAAESLCKLARASELTQRNIDLLGERLYQLATEQAEWSQATFGTDAERGPIGTLKHLAKEANEATAAAMLAAEACDDAAHNALRSELADCLILLLDASRRAGIMPLELLQAGIDKMAVNKARTWPKPKNDEPCEHVC